MLSITTQKGLSITNIQNKDAIQTKLTLLYTKAHLSQSLKLWFKFELTNHDDDNIGAILLT